MNPSSVSAAKAQLVIEPILGSPEEGNLRPLSFLGSGLFDTFRTACQDAHIKYVKESRQNRFDLETLGAVKAEMERAGFEVLLDPAIAAKLDLLRAAQRERIEGARTEVRAATSRLDRVDAELAARGLFLYPFQREGVCWLAARQCALLADQMGLGKTVQALIAIPDGAPVLIVCPAALKGVWLREARRWRPEYRPIVLSGRGSFFWPGPGEMVICNYDILPAAVDANGDAPDPEKRFRAASLFVDAKNEPAEGTVIIPDEAHCLKNKKATRTRRFTVMAKTARKKNGRVWLLTATPLLNRPPELWNVLSAADLAEEAFGTYVKFTKLFSGRKTMYGTEWGKAKADVPALLRRVSLQRRREEVLPDLPTKTYCDRMISDLSNETKDRLNEVMDRLLQLGIDIREEHFDTSKISGEAFEELARARADLATAKIPALLEFVEEHEENEEPLVVFSAHRAPVDILGTRPGWAAITGDTSADERSRIVDAFQAGKLKGVAATIQAGGVGITLTHGARAVFVDLMWTPALNEQAEDRVCRIGQDRGVLITRLVVDHPIDYRVMEVLVEKQKLIRGSVEASARREVKEEDVLPETDEIPDFKVHDGSRPAGSGTPSREAKTPIEEWAARGLVALAAMDPDHAWELNGVGFSRMDNSFGHSLANTISTRGKLSEKQWVAAVRLATRYRGQLAPAPIETKAPAQSGASQRT